MRIQNRWRKRLEEGERAFVLENAGDFSIGKDVIKNWKLEFRFLFPFYFFSYSESGKLDKFVSVSKRDERVGVKRGKKMSRIFIYGAHERGSRDLNFFCLIALSESNVVLDTLSENNFFILESFPLFILLFESIFHRVKRRMTLVMVKSWNSFPHSLSKKVELRLP